MSRKPDWLKWKYGLCLLVLGLLSITLQVLQRQSDPNPSMKNMLRESYPAEKTRDIGYCFDVLDATKYELGRCTVQLMGGNLRDLEPALTGKQVLMIGDSRTMQLFRYIRSLLSGRFDEERLFASADHEAHFTDSDRNFSMHNYFKPFPDPATRDIIHEWTVRRSRKPDFLFYETGAWSLYIHGPQFETEFRDNLTSIAEDMARTRNTTIPIWIRTLPVHPDVPSHKPGWVNILYNHTDILIEKFGQAVEDVARAHNFTVWTSAHHVAKRNPKYYRDNLHPGLPMLRLFACQMITALQKNRKNC